MLRKMPAALVLAAALAMSDGNTRLKLSECLAFPPLIVSAVSAGSAGRCDALVSVRALRISVTLWLSG